MRIPENPMTRPLHVTPNPVVAKLAPYSPERLDLPIDLLQALLVGADEAADHWFTLNWHQLSDAEIERFTTEVFAIFRRMMESPPTT